LRALVLLIVTPPDAPVRAVVCMIEGVTPTPPAADALAASRQPRQTVRTGMLLCIDGTVYDPSYRSQETLPANART
jgi:hypothetical protein